MLMDDGALGHFVDALQSVPDKMKQTGFYVDLGRDFTIRSSPMSVTKDAAEKYFTFTRRVLMSICDHL